MKPLLSALAIVLLAGTVSPRGLLLGSIAENIAARQVLPSPIFTIIVDGPASAVGCHYWASLRGGKGGSGAYSSRSAPRTIKIEESAFDARAVEQLQAFIYCPGFEVVLLDVPSVAAVGRTAQISPTPASMTRVMGTVAFPLDRPRPQNAEIEVTHI